MDPNRPERTSPASAAKRVPHIALSGGDARFVNHLHFEHLRNLTTLSVSATGGGLVAVQAGLLDLGLATAVPLICFALTAILSLLTQRTLIRDLATDRALSRRFALMSETSSLLFAGGVGSAATILLFDQLL